MDHKKLENTRLLRLLDMLDDDSDDSFLLFAIAKEYEGLQDLVNTLKYYLVLKNNDPEYLGLYYHLAKLYEVLGEDQKALDTYHEGIAIAIRQKDLHSLSELKNALTNFEMEL